MDLSSYESFELPIPLELRGEVKEGVEVEYIQALGRRKIERVKVGG
jgi:translation initiation factor 5A